MKAIKYSYALLLLAFALHFTACTETNDGSFVAPITTYEKIQGSWSATSVKQTDEIAKANSEKVTEMALTDQFSFSTFTIKLNVDAQNQPTTYQIGGASPKFFPTDGYWSLAYAYPNTDATPSQIILYSDSQKATKTATLDIMTMPGSVKTLELKYTRKTKGIPFISYSFLLSPSK